MELCALQYLDQGYLANPIGSKSPDAPTTNLRKYMILKSLFCEPQQQKEIDFGKHIPPTPESWLLFYTSQKIARQKYVHNFKIKFNNQVFKSKTEQIFIKIFFHKTIYHCYLDKVTEFGVFSPRWQNGTLTSTPEGFTQDGLGIGKAEN